MTLIERMSTSTMPSRPESREDSLVAIAEAYLAYATEHRLPILAELKPIVTPSARQA